MNVYVRYGRKKIHRADGVLGFPPNHCATCGHVDEYHLSHGCFYMRHSRKVGGEYCYCPCFFSEAKEDYIKSITFIDQQEVIRNRELDE